MDCPYCKLLDEANFRVAMEERRPLVIERIDLIEPWRKISKDQWRAGFICDACGAKTDVVIELKDEPDPADWWKS